MLLFPNVLAQLWAFLIYQSWSVHGQQDRSFSTGSAVEIHRKLHDFKWRKCDQLYADKSFGIPKLCCHHVNGMQTIETNLKWSFFILWKT